VVLGDPFVDVVPDFQDFRLKTKKKPFNHFSDLTDFHLFGPI
jgi:hypothetical protein